jgi:hypothetical protein
MSTATATMDVIPTGLRHFVSQATTTADLPAEWTVEEATREITRALGLPARDTEDRPQHYELYRRRGDGTGELLGPSLRVRDAIRPGDELSPMPEVVPGAAEVG